MEEDDDLKIQLAVKELTVNNSIKYKQDIKRIQNSLISFCMNVNLFQKSKNVFELNLTDQLKFNECIDSIITRIQSDIADLETFYISCKSKCISGNPDIQENIDEYISKQSIIFQPELHPCIQDCTNLFKNMYQRYTRYLTKGKKFLTIDGGMYYEFIDYNNISKLI
jgi:hypothetical protein